MMLKLSKSVTETVVFDWCKKEFTTMSQEFRRARALMADTMDSCFWCWHVFDDGEMIALAGKKSGNVVLCQTCAGILKEADRG